MATAWEAFGIAIDFMPSTLVAPLVGVTEFGLGSTLCFRAADFQAAGGFDSIADYIADDYHLARRIVQSGKLVHLSRLVVDTTLGDSNWQGVWNHQLRWARTIRASKGAGFAGLPVTYAGVWAIAAFATGAWKVAALLLLLRVMAALVGGWWVILLKQPAIAALLAPVWDLFAFAVWIFSYTSNEVRWRDRRLRIVADGRLEPL
jgi:ceramide glucosyltransferase